MKKTICTLMLLSALVSCNKSDGGSGSNCATVQAPDGSSQQVCSTPDSPAPPVSGTTSGSTSGTGSGTTSGSGSGHTTSGTGSGTTSGTGSGSTTGSTTGGNTSVPTEALTFGFHVQMINMTAAQEDKINKAIELVRKVFASEEFRSRVLNYTYNGQKAFVDNKGMTNAQIYQAILDGAELMYPAKNNAMDLEVELYTNNLTSTIGYTNPSTTKIYMNTKYFNTYTPVNVSDNLTHEWLHKIGFDHAQTWSPSRDHSVPYAIGYLVEELAAKLK